MPPKPYIDAKLAKDPLLAMFRYLPSYIRLVRHDGAGWTLEPPDAVQIFLAPCHYCNKLPQIRSRFRHIKFFRSNITRLDPRKNYELGNCVAACRACTKQIRQQDIAHTQSVVSYNVTVERVSMLYTPATTPTCD